MAVGRNGDLKVQLVQLSDAFLVWTSMMIAAQLRDPLRVLFQMSPADEPNLWDANWVLFLSVPLLPLILERFGFYERTVEKEKRKAFWQMSKAYTLLILIIGLLSVFAQFPDARRLILVLGGSLSFLLIFLRDRILYAWMRKRAGNDERKERVVIAGTGKEIDLLLAEIDPVIRASWHVVDRFDFAERDVDDLYLLLKQHAVQRVLFVAGHAEFAKVSLAVEACELQGVEAWISSSFIRTRVARPEFDTVGDKPMLVLRSTPGLSWELLAKEVMDRVGALVLIILTSPLWLFAAIGIRRADPSGPVFFSQMRAGRYGKPFRMWKFRTMVTNAPELLEKIKQQHGNQMSGPVFKLDHDPRIFPFGAMLRKLSIDELPQLYNVLRGDISLVGPRPLPVYEVEAFADISHRRRLSVKPGITCEWQAGGRNKITSFDDWVKLDLQYIDNWCLWLDVKLLLKTIPAVLFSRGAK